MIRVVLSVSLAIAFTTALDAGGYTAFSALPLIPLFALFAWLDRLPRRSLGLLLGKPANYALAVGHPVVVMASWPPSPTPRERLTSPVETPAKSLQTLPFSQA